MIIEHCFGGRYLCACVVFGLLLVSPTCAKALQSGDFTYEVTPSNTVTITDYTGAGVDVVVPSVISNSAVTAIGYRAFSHSSGLRGVTIPDGIITIGDLAFYSCWHLLDVAISGSVRNIGSGAFTQCGKLENIAVSPLNEAYSSVDGVLFNKQQTELICCGAAAAGSYTIPTTVTSIGNHAFDMCSRVTNISIPDSVTNIGEYVFVGCYGLTRITIPNSVTSIGEAAFQACINLDSITIPSSVNSIGRSALYYCSGLTNITLSSGVTSIGDFAFGKCIAVAAISIPDSVTSIGIEVFRECSSLANIWVSSANPSYSSIDGVLFNKQATQLVCYGNGRVGAYSIPTSVTNIGMWAFIRCSGLPHITIPDSVTSIGGGAFVSCSGLTTYLFRGNAPSLGFSSLSQSGTVYYRIGTSGWGPTFGERPTMACTAVTPEMIPYDWLLTNFPSIVTTDDYEDAAIDDQDADGMSTWAEYVAGTGPTNRSQRLALMLPKSARDAVDVVIEWATVSNRKYSVYSSTNLATSWPADPVYQVLGDGTPKSYTNTDMNQPRFFRIGVRMQ